MNNKTKVVAIMQPTYLPWLGYFDLIDRSDMFVFFDDVQLTRRSWQVRNRIKFENRELYLTVPVKKTKSRDEQLINNAVINNNESWRARHLDNITHAYRKSVYFNDVFTFLENTISNDVQLLSDLNIEIIKNIASQIGINAEFILSSNIKGVTGKKDERLVSICKKLDCDIYISPMGSAAYIEKNTPGGMFPPNNIELYYQNYEHPAYKQLGTDFISHMSIIDLLFSEGFNKSLEIVRTGRRDSIGYLDYRKIYKKEENYEA